MKTVAGRSKHIGAYVDVSAWAQDGLNPIEETTALKDRIIGFHLRDRSARGGAARIPELIAEINRLRLKPFLTVDSRDGLSQAFANLNKALQPIMAEALRRFALTTPILRPDLLTSPEERRRMETQLSDDLRRYDLSLDETKQKIEAALPKQSPAEPKRPCKLLIVDLCVGYNGHLANRFAVDYALDLMGKKTGAFEPTPIVPPYY